MPYITTEREGSAANALCEATKQFLKEWTSPILNGRYTTALFEDLHQLTALVGAWERAKTLNKHLRQAACIRDGCGLPYDPAESETRDPNTLRAFWTRYCPKHRTPPEPPVIITEQSPNVAP